MLEALSANITASETPKPPPPPFNILDHIQHVSDIGIDDNLNSAISDELTSLDLLGGKENKVTTKWLSPTNDSYNYGSIVNHPNPIANYPNICKLMSLVNNHPSTTGDMDACIVSCFPSNTACLNLHKDKETLISQNSSICTVSFGATRELQFVLDGKKKKKKKNQSAKDYSVDHILPSVDRTMNVMKPGCQLLMKHRVSAGNGPSAVRYSVSFRKISSSAFEPPPKVPPPPPKSSPSSNNYNSNNNNNNKSDSSSKEIPQPSNKNIVLVAGDSFAARLDAKRLGKGKQDVHNIAKGGSKIKTVLKSLEDFAESNPLLSVKKLFLSIGTNDIRNCSEGIKHLKNPLCDFMRRIFELFPTAKVYLQAIPPIHSNGCKYTEKNVVYMNNLIFDICSRFKLYYLDIFRALLDEFGFRNKYLFPNFDTHRNCYDIHPNAKGMGVLAKFYIYCIHSKRFNPMGY